LMACARGREANYASSECSARIIECSRGAEKVANVLNADRDAYARFPAALPAVYFVVELCQAVQVESVLLANEELFSACYGHVEIAVTKRLDTPWTPVGQFDLQDPRMSTLPIATRTGFVRFVRLELSKPTGPPSSCYYYHHRHHHCHHHHCYYYYATLSWIKVLGRTMIEDFESHMEVLEDHYYATRSEAKELIAMSPVRGRQVKEGQGENVYRALHERLTALEADSKLMFQTLLTRMNQRPSSTDHHLKSNSRREVLIMIALGQLMCIVPLVLIFACRPLRHAPQPTNNHAGPTNDAGLTPTAVHSPRSFTPARPVLDGEEPVAMLSSPLFRHPTRKQ
jgi:hypothetical protein